jgi:hypothetical protein
VEAAQAMSRGNLVNLGLLVFIGILALLALYEPGIDAPPEKPRLLDIEREAVNRIHIERNGQKSITLVSEEPGQWRLVEPLDVAASDYRISSLLRITEQKSLGSYPADEERLAGYGLAEPRIVLTLNDTQRVAFGNSTPLDQRRYVLVGDRVHLVSDTLYYHLIGQYTTFIRQTLLPEGSAIQALSLPGLSIRLEGARWQVEPKPEPYSADQVTQLVDAWKLASAIEIKPYDGQEGEPVSIQLKGEEAPRRFLLTARSPDLVLARPDFGIEYHLAPEGAGGLLALSPMDKGTAAEPVEAE